MKKGCVVCPRINLEINMHESPPHPTIPCVAINCLLMYAYTIIAGSWWTVLVGEVEVRNAMSWTLPLTKHSNINLMLMQPNATRC